eukprot:scaffold111698_cov33-Tisochrysis_lutea.AAC.3
MRRLAPHARHLAGCSSQQSLAECLAAKVQQGQLAWDEKQHELALVLEKLRCDIRAHHRETERYAAQLIQWRGMCEQLAAEAEAEEARRMAIPAWRRALERIQAALYPRPSEVGSSLGRASPSGGTEPEPRADEQASGTDHGCSDASDDPLFRRLRLAQARAHQDGEFFVDGDRLEQHQKERLSAKELQHPFWRTGIGAPVGASQRDDKNRTVPSGKGLHLPGSDRALPPGAPPPPQRPATPRGLFIHGSVGSGKTLLMDLFAEAVLVDQQVGQDSRHNDSDGAASGAMAEPFRCVATLRRVHHNSFMIECHRRLHAHSNALAASLRSPSSDAMRHADAEGLDTDDTFSPTPSAQRTNTGWHNAWFSDSGFAFRTMVDRAVVRLVSEGEQPRPEVEDSFAAAMQRISASIAAETSSDIDATNRSGEYTRAKAPAEKAIVQHVQTSTSSQPGRLLLDERGHPVSVGVLCYDEIAMMDIADATIVRGVLTALINAGWVLVATCNRTPKDFSASSMHREHPQARFSEAISEHCDTFELGAEQRDYRKGLHLASEPSFFCHGMSIEGSDGASSPTKQLDSCFETLTRGRAAVEAAPIGSGRALQLLASGGVARTSFEELCGASLGAGDYVALAQRYHTLCVDSLPQMSLNQRDKARRFISLVDQLYNHKTRLVVSSEVPIEQLFSGTLSCEVDMAASALEGVEFEGEAGKVADLNPIGNPANTPGSRKSTGAVSADSRKAMLKDSLFTGEDEIFAFRRALSRLAEMQSAQYLASRFRGPNSFPESM